jgi:hypothetical protein
MKQFCDIDTPVCPLPEIEQPSDVCSAMLL